MRVPEVVEAHLVDAGVGQNLLEPVQMSGANYFSPFFLFKVAI